jgi:hypothetical protein
VNYLPQMLSGDEVRERIDDLRNAHAPFIRDRIRIRSIMNGGVEGIRALLGPKAATRLGSEDLPVVHLMDSGLTRLAQRLGRAPDAKIDVPVDAKLKERKSAEKRERILVGLDYQTRFELTLPQAGRWLPGYAFVPYIICEGKGRNGEKYAKAEIRNSFDCFPGQWGPDSQPEEIAFIRLASKRRLARRYPAYAEALRSRSSSVAAGGNGPWGVGGGASGGLWSPGRMAWEGAATSDAVMLGEYMDSSGTYLMCLDDDSYLLDFVPNPIPFGPAFELARRPSFDVLRGQYDHVIGLMAMMAKLNVLAYIANEDAVFRETNIVGDLIGDTYKRGRHATNYFTPGTSINKPSNDISYQVFNQIDRVERQLRVGTNYSVIQDSESPNSFATGRGLDKLSDSSSANVEEYQLQLRYAIEGIDAKRLAWEEAMYGSREKHITGVVRGVKVNETYRASKDIAGDYDSRRVYGVMAGWDSPEVIVTGLQLLQAEAIDIETFQDNLYGLENKSEINKRVRAKKSEDRLYDVLSTRAQEGDPRAEQALVSILSEPEKIEEILKEFYTPPEVDPAVAAQQAMDPAAGGGAPMGAPPAVTTALSRIMASGQTDAGVQTVGRI